MVRRILYPLVGAIATVLLVGSPVWACEHPHGEDGASAQTEPAAAADREGASKNVEFLGNLPETAGAIAINFLRYGSKREVMLVAGEFGLKAYDISDDPANPVLLDELNMPGMWEMEDTEVDQRRKLVFLSRDPRAFGGNTRTGASGIYIVDARHPGNLELVTFVSVPAGHTTSCVNDCKYLWTGGPAPADWMPDDWGGRPVWVTDVRNPRKPRVFPDPVDTHRDDGQTDYAHDVQVDASGVAWVSGAGGVRGYWTKGRHYDPVRGEFRVARPWDPIPYAGGHIDELSTFSDFMHNSFRPVGPTADEAHDPGDWPAGSLIYATEETFRSGCDNDGLLVIASLMGSHNGQSWRSTPENPFRLETVSTWGVAGKEGSDPDATSCSAHYFEVRDGILVQSFYEQGTRFLDVSDPTDPTQVAYYRPGDARSWAPYWHGDVVYVADNTRGVDIIRPTLG